MGEESLDLALDPVDSYSTRFTISSHLKSSPIYGATEPNSIYSTSQIVLHDTLTAFLSYVKTFNIPVLPVSKPDIRTVLGQGTSFLVNGCEIPKDYFNLANGNMVRQGTLVAMKRAKLKRNMHRKVEDRIAVIYNEMLTMIHPPLAAHTNIVNLLGIGFEIEGKRGEGKAIPVLITEYAELGNLAEVLETARKEERPFSFEDKISFCLDVAYGLEILHACDIVHGDVKCENILVFDKHDPTGPEGSENAKFCAKLTDFGAVRLSNGDFALGGSTPWQAPEIAREAAFKVDDAKRTDIFSFGMLLWRVCLDGDPFGSLRGIEGTKAERRQKRNNIISEKKKAGTLISHVHESLALSDRFTELQLKILCDVICITLPREAGERVLHLSQIIRMLSYNAWYEERHPIVPSRMPANIRIDLIDFGRWYSEFEGLSPSIQTDILIDLCEYASSPTRVDGTEKEIEEKVAAAYQLAICYANGFAGEFQPKKCLEMLRSATNQGSQKANDALGSFQQAFPDITTGPEFALMSQMPSNEDNNSAPASSWVIDLPILELPDGHQNDHIPEALREATWLEAAQSGDYRTLELLLDRGTRLSASIDGVTPLHFLASWDLGKAEDLGSKFIKAGANVNAIAARGLTVGGTPLMWSVFENHIEHTKILLNLGATPVTATGTGENALSFAAKLHLVDHLRLLMKNIRPIDMQGQLLNLLEAAAGGDSRFTRITRHGAKWRTAAAQTLELLKNWNNLFPDEQDFRSLVVQAVHGGALSPFGRVNADVQICFITDALIEPFELQELLCQSVLSYNKNLFDALLRMGVPTDCVLEHGRTLLHLCARIPDHKVAAMEFAPRLLELGIDLERVDDRGLTPWMDAMLERKWDLADLLLERGADPLRADVDGFNILGLCIKTMNLGSLKFLLKYAGDEEFKHQFFLVNREKQITSLQLAASLCLPRAHAMKLEVMGIFLTVLKYFGKGSSNINFRSDGIHANATALEIAISNGVVHAARHLVNQKGVVLPDKPRLSALTQTKIAKTQDYLEKKNLERCVYIVENWERDREGTHRLAADWTNLKTIDESKVASSFETVLWDYSARRRYKRIYGLKH